MVGINSFCYQCGAPATSVVNLSTGAAPAWPGPSSMNMQPVCAEHNPFGPFSFANPDWQLQKDLDRYRERYRVQRATIKSLRARLTECRAKYLALQERHNGLLIEASIPDV